MRRFSAFVCMVGVVFSLGACAQTIKEPKAAPSPSIPMSLDEIPIQPTDAREMRDIAESVGCNIKDIRVAREDFLIPGNAEISYDGILTVSAYMPKSSMKSMVLHECAHLKQWELLGQHTEVLDKIYPPAEVPVPVLPTVGIDPVKPKNKTILAPGLEFNADCIAKQWGADIQYYTKDCSGVRGKAAADMIDGKIPDFKA